MSAEKLGVLKKDDFKTFLLGVSELGEINLDAVKNRIQYIDNLMDTFGQPPAEGDFLLMVTSGKPNSWVKLSSDSFKIGRDESSDIVLDDPRASRRHCQIRKENKGWMIEDQKSQNGIFINGKKMMERLLCEGDIIRIGAMELIYISNRKLDFA